MARTPTQTVTLTVDRSDQDITVLVGLFDTDMENGGEPVGLWSVIESIDEDGNDVDLTQGEYARAVLRAAQGEDETGW
jgi:hypothetical protein